MRLVALAAATAVLVLPGAAVADRTTSGLSAKGMPRTVLALKNERRHDVLVRVDGRTLRPHRRRVALDGHVGVWAYSPDRRKIAFGVGQALGLTLVDVRRMRRLGDVVTRNGEILVLSWLTPNRIVGVEQAAGLFVVDAVRRRLIRSEPLDGSVYGSHRAGSSLVLLLAPERRIGAARLVVVDSEGARRSVTLERIQAGSNLPHEEPPEGFVGEMRQPGLAVDVSGNRAFVAGAGHEPIAEVDLATLAIEYRTPTASRSLFGRLYDWLDPAAHAKGPVAGSFRSAVWLGGEKLAVSGGDIAVDSRGGSTTTPAGLAVIDTRSWSLERLDERATVFAYTAGMLLATGERTGLTGYAVEGARRFELFPRQRVWIWNVVATRAFVQPDGRALRVVDALSGRIVGTRSGMPRLLYAP